MKRPGIVSPTFTHSIATLLLITPLLLSTAYAGQGNIVVLDDFSSVRDREYSGSITTVGVSSVGATIERITIGCDGLATIRLSSAIVRPGAVVRIIDGTTTETVTAEMTAGADFTSKVSGRFNPGDVVSRHSLSFTVFGTGEITRDVTAVLRARQAVRLAMQARDPVQVAIVLQTNQGEIRKDFGWVAGEALLVVDVPRKTRVSSYRLLLSTGESGPSRVRLHGLTAERTE